jgi:hypothetical protein
VSATEAVHIFCLLIDLVGLFANQHSGKRTGIQNDVRVAQWKVPLKVASSQAKSQGRSRVSNGSSILPGVDGRSIWVRRLRDLIGLHIADIGGDAAVSEAERSIIRRAATLTVELERMEAAFAVAGEAQPAQLDLYQRTANSLRRLLESVGLGRRPRDVTPDLRDYIEGNAGRTTEAAE